MSDSAQALPSRDSMVGASCGATKESRGMSSSSGSGIELRLPQLEHIEQLLEQALEGRPKQAFYTLSQAWRLKHAAVIEEGAPSLDTFKKSRAYQPKGGVPDGWVSNKKVWTDATIEEWLTVTDDGLTEYLKKYNPACQIPDRIYEAIKRRSLS
jgi:hypothetical protein